MIAFPISKINIGLQIVSKRHDGYHDIETVFYPAGLCDALEFIAPDPAIRGDIFTISGIDIGTDPEKNLVMRAVRLLRGRFGIPFLKIHLHKAIPAGAGLGGGSSDAACAIRAINRAFRLRMTIMEMKAMAMELGSDCPFFIEGVPSIAHGRGEVLKQVKGYLHGYYLVLLNPGEMVSTKEAYESCKPAKPERSLEKSVSQPVERWKELITNDFEKFAFTKYPLIGELKEKLYSSGAVFSLMSGSGSTVYGIFREKPVLTGEIRKYLVYEGKV